MYIGHLSSVRDKEKGDYVVGALRYERLLERDLSSEVFW
jgi:hypothetical protein